MTPQENISHEQALKELQEKHHRIDYDTAAGMIGEFRKFVGLLAPKDADARPEIPECLTFNKKAILEILDKPGCIALRMYPAIKDTDGKKSFTLVLVGVDGSGENIVVKPTPMTDAAAKNAAAATMAAAPAAESGAYDETQTCPPYPKPQNNF